MPSWVGLDLQLTLLYLQVVLTSYALVKVMPHLPPTGIKVRISWGLDLKLLPS